MQLKLKISILSILLSTTLFAQQTLPQVVVKSINGTSVSVDTLSNHGKPMVVSFWATWCKPCVLELSTINDVYIDWQDETGVKLVAVSTDDTRSSSRVAPFVNGRAWEYEVLLDTNSDLKRAMNVEDIPHTFLLNGKGEIVWQHTGFAPGDEEELYEKIIELTETEE